MDYGYFTPLSQADPLAADPAAQADPQLGLGDRAAGGR
jgi:hypothetical protein